MNAQPNPERTNLQFKESVLSNFNFLSELGFRAVEEKVTFVRYESSGIFLNIFHGRSSFEMNVEIGRLSNLNNANLSVFGIVDWARPTEAEDFGKNVMFQTSTREGVEKFVPQLARLIRKYAIPLLRNDEPSWIEALSIKADRWRSYVEETNPCSMREKAEAAWHAKDFALVIELYRPALHSLTEIELKRLKFAERHGRKSWIPWRR